MLNIGNSRQLTPERSLLVIGAYIGSGGLLIASRYWQVEKLLKTLPMLMLIGALAVICFTFLQKPQHMTDSLSHVVQNMYANGDWWGLSWGVLLALFVASWTQPRLAYERLLTFTLIVSFILIIVLSFLRSSYRVGWDDSGNRMLIHLMPILCFYVILKFTNTQPADAA